LTQVKAPAYWNGAAFLAVGSIFYVDARRRRPSSKVTVPIASE
jgi:hypothetical protein